MTWFERKGWFQNLWRHRLGNEQLPHTYCPISQEVKEIINEILSVNGI